MVTGGPRPLALLFPGQGSQAVGMGKALHDALAPAREVFERADRALGIPLSRACFEGPDEALRLTATTQPAVLATSLAALWALRARLPKGLFEARAFAAGHSLGEYAALVAAGVLTLEDALRTVRRRGEYMQEAVPFGQGAMAALVGCDLPRVEALCREAAGGEVLAPANLNAPDQTVVAGTASAVARLEALARSRGVRKVVRLPVSAPFHCALMGPAQERLAAVLAELTLRDAALPVLPNVTASPETLAEPLRQALVRQVTAPVRWVETVERLEAMGVRTVIEVGPGRVLSGLARRIAPALRVANVEDPRSLEGALAAIEAPGGDVAA
jgi:[acyl-carrier-protein] S-malonyltransferase